ncbi:MAG: FAD-dependent monooxygenase [Burkholderiaceae bacterium]
MRVRVVGRGPVALSFGLLLARQGLAPDRIELDTTRAALPPAMALRTLALSAGSWQLLGRICAAPPAAPIEAIEVSLQGHAGRVRLGAAEQAVPALGHVVRYPTLCDVLLEAAGPARFAEPDSFSTDDDLLIVHAEGDAGDDAEQREFAQSAIVAELTARAPEPGVAYERFTAEGPLAMLPLPEADRYALVWCCRPDHAQRRAAASDAAFATELHAIIGPRWSIRRVETARVAMPLRRRRRRRTVAGREVWIGNAAQALHPVAGQGFNLGLRDAFVLAAEIGRRPARPHHTHHTHHTHNTHNTHAARPTHADRDAGAVLERYAQARRADRARAIGLTDLLARVFTIAPLQPAESVALAALDLHGGARSWLARQMMFGVR